MVMNIISFSIAYSLCICNTIHILFKVDIVYHVVIVVIDTVVITVILIVSTSLPTWLYPIIFYLQVGYWYCECACVCASRRHSVLQKI